MTHQPPTPTPAASPSQPAPSAGGAPLRRPSEVIGGWELHLPRRWSK